MKLRMTELSYRINEESVTTAITVRFEQNEGSTYLNATIEITQTDFDDATKLDDLTRKEIEVKGRQILADLTKVETDASPK